MHELRHALVLILFLLGLALGLVTLLKPLVFDVGEGGLKKGIVRGAMIMVLAMALFAGDWLTHSIRS